MSKRSLTTIFRGMMIFGTVVLFFYISSSVAKVAKEDEVYLTGDQVRMEDFKVRCNGFVATYEDVVYSYFYEPGIEMIDYSDQVSEDSYCYVVYFTIKNLDSLAHEYTFSFELELDGKTYVPKVVGEYDEFSSKEVVVLPVVFEVPVSDFETLNDVPASISIEINELEDVSSATFDLTLVTPEQ